MDKGFVLTTVGLGLIFAFKDYLTISSGKSPNHDKGFTLRTFALILVTIYFGRTPEDLLENSLCGPVILGWVFQYSLNLMRGKHLMYMGVTSKFDRFFRRIGEYPMFVFWTILLIGSIGIKIWN